jgi:membrane associated rhomboid family serine protease
MILPIGHEESSVRRLPWVTFSLMIICVGVFLATDTRVIDAAAQPAELVAEVADYWRQHAYLEAEPKIRTIVAYDVMPNQRSQYLRLIEGQARELAPDDPEELAAEQAELDRLTDLALGRSLSELAESPDNPYRKWGLTPGQMRPVTLVTHMFMHAGWLHLLGNLFMLFLAGPALEDRLGRPLYALFYLTVGISAALFYAALTPDKLIPMIGASGAIAGVLGAFAVRFWSSNLKFDAPRHRNAFCFGDLRRRLTIA